LIARLKYVAATHGKDLAAEAVAVIVIRMRASPFLMTVNR
jgi:hypothetical protein